MEEKIKMPLATYVLYHSNYADGEQAFEMIYQLLCRDVKKPLTDGIDIPVYLRTSADVDTIKEIDFSESDKTAVIVLIDENMFCSEVWRNYLQQIVLISTTNANVKIYPIALYQYGFEILNDISKGQGLKAESNNYSFKDNWDLIQTRLLEFLYRFLTDPNSKVQLFISHAKKDCECKAKQLRDYLNSNTKLKAFFDANDILDANDFEEQLKDNVEKSLLVVLKSDAYSEREWCRKEVIIAKRNNIPTIVVDCINKGSKRLFPYLGNCPMVQYSDNWSEMIICLLKSALNQTYQNILLNKLKANDTSINDIIPHMPELFSFVGLKNDESQKVIYPEPPLGNEEKEVLRDCNSKIVFVTPTEAKANNIPSLAGKSIAFSISDSDDINKYGCSKSMYKDIVLELSRYVLKAGAKLVYGGDLRKDGFTEIFEDFSYQYGQQENKNEKVEYFTNYFAWPIHLKITKSIEADFKHKRVNCIRVDAPDGCMAKDIFLAPVGNENLCVWSHSLTKMREEMEGNVDARIFIGGRLSGFKGKMAGIVEEFLISARSGHPIYLIGGLGGATNAIVDIIEKNKSVDLKAQAEKNDTYKSFVDYYNANNDDKIDYGNICQTISQYSFDNGLTPEENKRLCHSTNILEIVSLVLKGLSNKFNEK